MTPDNILPIVKARLGISSQVRDTYLTAIINGVIDELESQQGIVLNSNNNAHLMFVADYSEYRYSNRDAPDMPRHLQWRLHNLILTKQGDADGAI